MTQQFCSCGMYVHQVTCTRIFTDNTSIIVRTETTQMSNYVRASLPFLIAFILKK